MVKINKLMLMFFVVVFLIMPNLVSAAELPGIPGINFGIESTNSPEDVSVTLQLILLLTILSIAPAILVLMTSFTRVVIVLSFTRNALATNQMPPNQVVIGLALFITFFIMTPVFTEVYDTAFQPYMDGNIEQTEALELAVKPFKMFMTKHTREKDLALFLNYANLPPPETIDDIPLQALVPAFAISELKTAFQIGFMLFIPFLVLDMIVASTLMAMGMMMLPPVMISLPFKVLLFVLVDGWYLVVRSLLISFN